MKYILSIILLILCMGMTQPVVAIESIPAVAKIDYALPYPGVLPDHHLYFMKRLRDWTLEKVIIEPVRKSEFYILQADKRLQMGIMLIEQKKFSLAETTISKAEKYMEKAVVGLATYKTGGGVIAPYVIEHAEKALAKHIEVLQELLVQVPVTSSIELATRVQQEIKALK